MYSYKNNKSRVYELTDACTGGGELMHLWQQNTAGISNGGQEHAQKDKLINKQSQLDFLIKANYLIYKL